METLMLKLPESIVKRIKSLSQKEEYSIEHFIELAVYEKLSTLEAIDYLEERAKKGNIEKYQSILSKVPAREPLEYDK